MKLLYSTMIALVLSGCNNGMTEQTEDGSANKSQLAGNSVVVDNCTICKPGETKVTAPSKSDPRCYNAKCASIPDDSCPNGQRNVWQYGSKDITECEKDNDVSNQTAQTMSLTEQVNTTTTNNTSNGTAVCGNNIVEDGEKCDGNTTECKGKWFPPQDKRYTSGTLTCNQDCEWDDSNCGFDKESTKGLKATP